MGLLCLDHLMLLRKPKASNGQDKELAFVKNDNLVAMLGLHECWWLEG